MPGLVGLISKMPREWAEAQLVRMVEVLRHEPFYTSGTWVDESQGVYAGWIAQKNSFAGRMPLLNETGDVCLLFSGEDYPEPGTALRLKGRGHSIEMPGASYLVHLYEDDPSSLTTLNGQFHGLLVDQRLGTATLFNDRIGMHRLYYHRSKEAFYFAAEAKAILAVRPELHRACPRGLGEIVSLSCVMENRTLFEDIYLLPSASKWVFRHGLIEQKTTYFHPQEWENQPPLEHESYYCELRDTLARNLPRYFNGDLPIGVALTGGLDTRVLIAWHDPKPGSLPCYTWGGTYRECQDVRLARKVADVCAQPYEVVNVGQKFLSNFAHYAERAVYLTDASVGTDRSSDLFVSERARQIAPVKVVGTYGSEMLCRLRMFKPSEPRGRLFRPEFLAYTHQARDTYANLVRVNPVTFVAFRQSPWYHHGILSLEQTQLTVRSPFLDNDFAKAVFRAPQSGNGQLDIRRRLIAERSPDLAKIPTDRGIRIDSSGPVTEARHAFQEFTFKAEYAYDYGMPQWLARIDHLFAPFHLERIFLGRHKFAHYRVWFRDALSNYVRQMLLDSRTLSRPYLNPKAVEDMVTGHLKGNQNFTTEIHRLLTLELFHRLFVDSR